MSTRSTPEISFGWLMSHVTAEDGCLVWNGYCGVTGDRPKASKGGETFLVQKAVWEMARERRFPAKRNPVMACGVENCCHPDHVRALKVNARRTYSSPNIAQRAKVAATKRKASKMPEAAVQALRAGEMTDSEAADLYGVSRSTAFYARKGLSWRDYTSPFAQLMGAA
ncbi:hypothetical protein D9M73_70620 [compost metagenome]|nr:MAG TPA: PROTEIN/DNA Complex catalytic motif, Helix-turn-helix DNA [Caudoviricetes sp.]